MINTELLKQRIESSGYRFNWIAKQLDLTSYGFRKKASGKNEFKVSEIVALQKILKLSNGERDEIFFI